MAGEATSNVGNNLFDIAIMWYLYKVTNSPSLISGVTGLFNLLVLLNLFTGVVSDKHSKTVVMLVVDFFQITVMLIAGWVYSLFSVSFWMIVLVSFLSKAAGCFFAPAEDTLIPELVTEDSLTKANGINQGVTTLSGMTGMLVGSTLISLISIADFAFLNAVSFFISLVCLLIVQRGYTDTALREQRSQGSSAWYDGIAYIKDNRVLRVIVFTGLLLNFCLGPVMSLTVVWVKGILKGTAMDYSIAQIALMVGVILGSIGASVVKKGLKQKMIVSFLSLSLIVVAMALLKNMITYFILRILIGFFAGIINVSIFTSLQTNTPSRLLGRVSGALLAGTNLFLPLGMLVGGALVNFVGVAVVFMVGGGLSLLSLPVIFRM